MHRILRVSVLLAAALLAGCGGDGDEQARDKRATTVLPLAAPPDDIAAEGRVVWVVSREGGSLVRIAVEGTGDRPLPRVTHEVEGLPEPDEVAVGGGSVWVLCAGDGTLRRFDARSGRERGRPLRLGAPLGLAVGGGWIWALSGRTEVSARTGALTRVDPHSGRRVGRPARIRFPTGAIAFASGAAWVGGSFLHRVTAPPGARRAKVERLPVDDPADSLAAGKGKLWSVFGTLSEIDLSSGDPGEEPHPSGFVVRSEDHVIGPIGSLTEVAVGHGAVWVTGGLPRSDDVDFASGISAVVEVDESSGAPRGRPVVVGRGYPNVATNDAGVWVATSGDDSLTLLRP